MSQLELSINLLIAWHEPPNGQVIERLLWMHSSGNPLFFIRVCDPGALPFSRTRPELEAAFDRGEFRIITADPYAFIQKQESSISGVHRARRDEAWKIISQLVAPPNPEIFDPKARGRLIDGVIKAESVTSDKLVTTTKTTVYKYLRRYWQGGQTINALLPHYQNCGAKGKERAFNIEIKRGRPSEINGSGYGINIGEKEREYIRLGYKAFYLTRNGTHKPTHKDAYNRTLEKYFHRGFQMEDGAPIPVLPHPRELPSLRQFKYWGKKVFDTETTLRSREGEKRFNLKHRAITGESTSMAFGPGSLFQIDSTIADLNLIGTIDHRPIGRPVLYLVIDVFSRMIVGFAITLENPSYVAAMMAIENAAQDKVKYCAEYGITIQREDWPCQYLPEALLADRGELIGEKADNLVKGLNIRISNTPPYRADMKAIVERSFRSINDVMIRWLPGASSPRATRGDRDPRLDSKLTMDQFRKAMINCILSSNTRYMEKYPRNKDMIQAQIPPIPKELWGWGILNRSGKLKTLDQEIIWRQLLPTTEATVTERGIRCNALYYSCPLAVNDQWFTRARNQGKWKIQVSYDPRHLDEIFFINSNTGRYETVKLLEQEKRFESISLDEKDVLDETNKRMREEAQNEEIQRIARLHARTKHISQEQVENFPVPSQHESKRARLNGIRPNRLAERELERKTEKSHKKNASGSQNSNIAHLPALSDRHASNGCELPTHSAEWDDLYDSQNRNNF